MSDHGRHFFSTTATWSGERARFVGLFQGCTGLWTAGCWLARRLHQLKASTTMNLGISFFPRLYMDGWRDGLNRLWRDGVTILPRPAKKIATAKNNRPVQALDKKKKHRPVPSRRKKKKPPRPASEKKTNRPVPPRKKKKTAPSRLGKKKNAPSRLEKKTKRPVPP